MTTPLEELFKSMSQKDADGKPNREAIRERLAAVYDKGLCGAPHDFKGEVLRCLLPENHVGCGYHLSLTPDGRRIKYPTEQKPDDPCKEK